MWDECLSICLVSRCFPKVRLFVLATSAPGQGTFMGYMMISRTLYRTNTLTKLVLKAEL